jgi:hypothetical protein
VMSDVVKSDLGLWVWILVSPAVWFFSLETNYALASLACAGGGKTILYAVTACSLGVTAAAAAVCGNQLRLLQPSRKRAMALAGAALGSFFFFVILAQAIPNVMLAGCE